MRNLTQFISLFFLLFLFTPKTYLIAQPINENWEVLSNSPLRIQRHDDMFFVNPSVGWVANGFGKVYRTTDSGDTWDEIASEGVFLRSIGFANEQKGWVGTFVSSSVLLETNDGGVTWIDVSDRISGPAITGICGLSVVNEDVVFGVGKFDGPAIFLKTVDGGASWQSTDLSVHGINTLIDVHFFDENRGIITGGTKADFTGQAIVAETIDGGDTWQVRHTSNLAANVGGEWGWKISFPTETTGYISVEYPFSNTTGNEAKVLKTTDGGISWSEIFVTGSTEPAGLQGVGFVSEDIGWVSGRGTASITTDGGESWQQVDDLDGIVNRIRLVNDTLAFAVGRRVYRWQGESIATSIADELIQPKVFTLAQNYPNPFNPSTTIRYTLHQPAEVRVRVLNVLGEEVRHLVNGHQAAGPQEVVWDGRDDAGQRVASGTYLYLIDMGEIYEMKMMVLLK